MEQPAQTLESNAQIESTDDSTTPETNKVSSGISKKVLFICILALFVSIALLLGFTMGQKTANTEQNEPKVVSQPDVNESEEVSVSALNSLDSKFDYYLMNDCGVAVPKIANYNYTKLTDMDKGRYWNLRVAEQGDEDIVSVGFEGTQSDMQENPLKYANGYGAAYYSVECKTLPSGVNNVDDLFNYMNEEAQSSEYPMELFNIGEVTMWGQDVIKYYASEGMYASEDYPNYIMVYKGKYIEIRTMTQTSSKEVSDDLDAQFDAIVFY
jgi:hypothetical protein